MSEIVDADGPGSVWKCHGVALADLGDVEGFNRSGEEDQLYAFQLSDGVYKRKKFTPSEGIESLKFEQLSDVDISHQRRTFWLYKGIGMLKLGRMHRQTGEFVDPTANSRQMREVSDF